MKKYCILLIFIFSLFGTSARSTDLAYKSAQITTKTPEAQIGSTSKTPHVDDDPNAVQVDDIYVACKYYFSKLFNTRENVSRKNICNGYFFGSASMLLLLQSEGVKTNTCIPMDISTEEIIRGFLEWTDNNQDKMKMLASQALLEIIRHNYSCNEYTPPQKKKEQPTTSGTTP